MMARLHNITLAISFIFLAVILYYADWHLIFEKSHLITVTPLLLAAIVYIAFMTTKVARFTALMPDSMKPGFSTLYYVMTKHAYYLCVLPVRLGDIYYSTLLKSHTDIPHRFGNLSLVLVRIYDVLILGIFTISSLAFMELMLPEPLNTLIITLSLTCVLVLFNLDKCLGLLLHLLGRRINRKMAGEQRLLSDFYHALETLRNELASHNSPKKHFKLLISSFLNWSAPVIMLWLIINMFRLDVSLVETLFFVGLMNLFSIIPVQTIGGFGLLETGLFTAMLISGMGYQESISYSVIARFILYLVQLAATMLIMLFYRIFMKSRINSIQSDISR